MNRYVSFMSFLWLGLMSWQCSIQNDSTPFDPLQLEGLWQAEGTIIFYQYWQQTTDSSMTGMSFSLNGADTIPIERVSINFNKDNISLEKINIGHTETAPQLFAQSESKPHRLIVKNLQNSYPSTIEYHLFNDSLLTVTMANSRGNQQKRFELKKTK